MLARRLVHRLGEGERETLDLPRVSPEVVAYCKARPGWEAARREAAAILVEPYRKRIAENSLLLVAGEQGIGSSTDKPWRLERAELRQVNLRGARLAGAWLERADLEGSALAGADLRGARLEGAVLDGADLGGADVRGAAMKSAKARGAILDGTRFEGADLREVGFEGSSAFAEAPVLRGARLEGACIRGTAWRAPTRGVELCELVGAEDARWCGSERIEQAGEDREVSLIELALHRDTVTDVAFSPDGMAVGHGCDDHPVRIWEARTGRLLQALPGNTKSIHFWGLGRRMGTGCSRDPMNPTGRWGEGKPGRMAAKPSRELWSPILLVALDGGTGNALPPGLQE